MKYHQPGWNLIVTEMEGKRTVEYSYQVWAPQTQEDQDRMRSPNPPRDHWSACIQIGWRDDDGGEYHDLPGGGFWKGDSFDAVTECFPTDIYDAFKKAMSKGGRS
jgi:hypothetical protein